MGEAWCPDGTASRAVLFGAAIYRSTELPRLPAVDRNLLELRARLTEPGRGLLAAGSCRLVGAGSRKPADTESVGAALTEAVREATDLLLVYYAGHGLPDHRGRLHLALAHTDPAPDTLAFNAIPIESVLALMGQARARARVLILDCCYSGRAVPTMTAHQTTIAEQLKRSGTYTLTSTTKNDPSFAPLGQRHTAFTAALLRTLEGPHALTLDEIYTFIHDDLTGRDLPPPQRHAVNAGGHLTLLRGARPQASPTDGLTVPAPAAPGRPGPPRTSPPTGSTVFVRALEPPSRKRWLRRFGALMLLLLAPATYGSVMLIGGVGLLPFAPFVLILACSFVFDPSEVRHVLTVDAAGLSRSVDPPAPDSTVRIPWSDILYVGVHHDTSNEKYGTAVDRLLVRLRQGAPAADRLTMRRKSASDNGAYYHFGTLAEYSASRLLLRDALLRYCPDDYINDKGPCTGDLAYVKPMIY